MLSVLQPCGCPRDALPLPALLNNRSQIPSLPSEESSIGQEERVALITDIFPMIEKLQMYVNKNEKDK